MQSTDNKQGEGAQPSETARRWDERLNARVRAHNRVNKRALELHGELVEIFRPFIGKKVLTNSGFVAKLRPQIDAIRDREGSSHEGGFQLYYNGGRYSLVFTLKAWEPYKGEQYGGSYAEASIYVGEFGNQTSQNPEGLPQDHLASVRETPPDLRTDYSADEVRALRKAEREASEKAREAESALSPFGRYDQ
jgi:hypothetical protein